MVLIEFLFDLLEVEVILAIMFPWQAQEGVEVAVLHRVVGRLRVEPFQLLHLFLEHSLNGIAPLLFRCAGIQFVQVLVGRAQFLLYGAYLLLQEVFTLLLRQVFSRT